MTTPEESIELDSRVEDVYAFGVPLVLQPARARNELDQLLERIEAAEGDATATLDGEAEINEPSLEAPLDPAVRALARHVIDVFLAVRQAERPSSVLHALLVRDWQDVGSLAAVTNCDPPTVERELGLLVDSGLAHFRTSDGFREYSIVWSLAARY